MEHTLTDIMISAHDDQDLVASFNAGLAMKHLLLARLYMAKFLDTNEQKAVDRVHEEFRYICKSKWTSLIKNSTTLNARKMMSVVLEAKSEYTTTFDNASKDYL